MTIRSSLEQVYIQIIRLLPLIALLILLRLLENLHPVLLCIFAWNISSASSSSFSVFLHRWMLLSPFSQSLKKREINCYVPSLVFSFLFSLSPFLILWKFLGLKLFFSFLSDTPIEKHVTLACFPADLLARLSTSDSFSLKNFAKDACMCRCAYVHRVETERWKEKMKTSLATLSCMLIFALFTSYSGEYRRCNHDCCLHTHGPTCKKKGVAHCICSTPRKEIEKMTAASTTT